MSRVCYQQGLPSLVLAIKLNTCIKLLTTILEDQWSKQKLKISTTIKNVLPSFFPTKTVCIDRGLQALWALHFLVRAF